MKLRKQSAKLADLVITLSDKVAMSAKIDAILDAEEAYGRTFSRVYQERYARGMAAALKEADLRIDPNSSRQAANKAARRL
jgi:hypothetical protein